MQGFTLAKGVAHAAKPDNCRKSAFTLAEVLITLGIIGVVAAITLPILIQNHQKQVYVNQLKKSVSTISQGLNILMAQDDVTRLRDTEAFSGMTADAGSGYKGYCKASTWSMTSEDCRSLREGLARVFQGIKFAPCDGTQTKYLKGTNASSKSNGTTCISFPDGSDIFLYEIFTDPNAFGGSHGYIYLDINGPKNPNTWGRDIFELEIGDNGVVSPRTSDYNDCNTEGIGMSCARKVLSEGKMNY